MDAVDEAWQSNDSAFLAAVDSVPLHSPMQVTGLFAFAAPAFLQHILPCLHQAHPCGWQLGPLGLSLLLLLLRLLQGSVGAQQAL